MGLGQFEKENRQVSPRQLVSVQFFSKLTFERNLLRHGVRNSLLIAPMPTASTAQILGNNESIEPYTSNIYTRRVLSGEFQVIPPSMRNVAGKRSLLCKNCFPICELPYFLEWKPRLLFFIFEHIVRFLFEGGFYFFLYERFRLQIGVQ